MSNDSTTFWRDFKGPGLPKTLKIEEQMSLEISCFFRREKIRPTPDFLDFGVHFEIRNTKRTHNFL